MPTLVVEGVLRTTVWHSDGDENKFLYAQDHVPEAGHWYFLKVAKTVFSDIESKPLKVIIHRLETYTLYELQGYSVWDDKYKAINNEFTLLHMVRWLQHKGIEHPLDTMIFENCGIDHTR